MFTIIARKFSAPEFREYCKTIGKQPWVKRIVLHNTGTPSLAQRPGGILTEQHIKNLHTYYAQTQKWSGGPHLFIDAEGIWVFNPLNDPGVHSPSYNSSAWGVEMLGDYASESFKTGLGAKVAENAWEACAILAEMQGWPDLEDQRLILHKEDPKTTHNCPGKNVVKDDFIARAKLYMDTHNGAIVSNDPPEFSVVVNGKVLSGAFVDKGVSFVPIRALSEALGFKVDFDPKTNQATIRKPD